MCGHHIKKLDGKTSYTSSQLVHIDTQCTVITAGWQSRCQADVQHTGHGFLPGTVVVICLPTVAKMKKSNKGGDSAGSCHTVQNMYCILTLWHLFLQNTDCIVHCVHLKY